MSEMLPPCTAPYHCEGIGTDDPQTITARGSLGHHGPATTMGRGRAEAHLVMPKRTGSNTGRVAVGEEGDRGGSWSSRIRLLLGSQTRPVKPP